MPPYMLRVTAFISCTFSCSALILNSHDSENNSSVHSDLYIDKNNSDKRYYPGCLDKCCPEHEYLYNDTRAQMKCISHNETLDFPNITLCNDNYIGNRSFYFLLIEKGHRYIHRPHINENWPVCCVDYLANGAEPHLNFWCFGDDGTFHDGNITNNSFYTLALLVSSVFLLLVLIVYMLLPELRNLGGKVLMAYVFSQLFSYLSQVIINIGYYNQIGCVPLLFLYYFFFLSSFCWMNVMSYEIFKTFRVYVRPINDRGECIKFMNYGLYAWGVPLAMTILLVTLMSHFSEKTIVDFITSKINVDECFFSGKDKFIFVYSPTLIMILCNWFFFLMTSFNIWRLSRGTQVLESLAAGNSAAHWTDKPRFIIYLKLSVVMGVNWLLELISFYISIFYPDLRAWYTTGINNLLISAIIFLVFAAKRKTFQKVLAKFRGIRFPRMFGIIKN